MSCIFFFESVSPSTFQPEIPFFRAKSFFKDLTRIYHPDFQRFSIDPFLPPTPPCGWTPKDKIPNLSESPTSPRVRLKTRGPQVGIRVEGIPPPEG